MEIFREFTFEAAHKLPEVPLGHKCGRLHGHSYRVEIHVSGEVQPDGMVMDFARLKEMVDPLIAKLDHYYLNDIPGLENPTSEVLAQFIWFELEIFSTLAICEVVVRETCTSGVSYKGPA